MPDVPPAAPDGAPVAPTPAKKLPDPVALAAESAAARLLWVALAFSTINSALVYASGCPLADPNAPRWLLTVQDWLHCSAPVTRIVLGLLPIPILWLFMSHECRRHLAAALPPLAPWRGLSLFLARLPIVATLARPFTCWRLASGYLPRRLLVLEALCPIVFYYTVTPRLNGWQLALGPKVWLAACLIPWIWAIVAGINDWSICETPPGGGLLRRWLRGFGFCGGIAVVVTALQLGEGFFGAKVIAEKTRIVQIEERNAADSLAHGFPPLRPEDNAARLYRAAFPLLERLWAEEGPRLAALARYAVDPAAPVPTAKDAAVLTTPQAQEVLAGLEQAAALPAANFGRHYPEDWGGPAAAAQARGFALAATLRAAQFGAALLTQDAGAADAVVLSLPILARHHADTLAPRPVLRVPGEKPGADIALPDDDFVMLFTNLARRHPADANRQPRLQAIAPLRAQRKQDAQMLDAAYAVVKNERLVAQAQKWQDSGVLPFFPAAERYVDPYMGHSPHEAPTTFRPTRFAAALAQPSDRECEMAERSHRLRRSSECFETVAELLKSLQGAPAPARAPSATPAAP